MLIDGIPQLATANKVHIIGVGDDGQLGLTASARDLIQRAELLIGADEALATIDSAVKRIAIGNDLDALIDQIRAHEQQRVVLLASGDPLFYGVARFLCDKLGKDRFEVVPHVSSMQLAFARVKESWDDAYLANLASQPFERVIEKTRSAEKVGLFTTDLKGPADVAAALLDRGIDYFSAYICENLGSPDERVTCCDLTELVGQSFSPLNVMILVRKPDVPDRPAEMVGQRLFGNPDELFLQSKPKRGLLTSMEVRVIALAEMDLGPRSTVWDVGAGSGSVAVEAARIAREGAVYAIEMDTEDYQLIAENAARFHVNSNLVPILGKAPEAWHDLPQPDAIFVGGTGRAVAQIVELALQRLPPGGRLVANVNSIDNLSAVHQVATGSKCEPIVRMIQIAHAMDQLDRIRFEGMNPTFLVSVVRA